MALARPFDFIELTGGGQLDGTGNISDGTRYA